MFVQLPSNSDYREGKPLICESPSPEQFARAANTILWLYGEPPRVMLGEIAPDVLIASVIKLDSIEQILLTDHSVWNLHKGKSGWAMRQRQPLHKGGADHYWAHTFHSQAKDTDHAPELLCVIPYGEPFDGTAAHAGMCYDWFYAHPISGIRKIDRYAALWIIQSVKA